MLHARKHYWGRVTGRPCVKTPRSFHIYGERVDVYVCDVAQRKEADEIALDAWELMTTRGATVREFAPFLTLKIEWMEKRPR